MEGSKDNHIGVEYEEAHDYRNRVEIFPSHHPASKFHHHLSCSAPCCPKPSKAFSKGAGESSANIASFIIALSSIMAIALGNISFSYPSTASSRPPAPNLMICCASCKLSCMATLTPSPPGGLI